MRTSTAVERASLFLAGRSASSDSSRVGTATDRWTHQHGLTNVWSHPPLNGIERYRGNVDALHLGSQPRQKRHFHLNQKPLEFMRRIVTACTTPGDVVWEPFGGSCSAAVAAVELARDAYAAEVVTDFRDMANIRLLEAIEAHRRVSHSERRRVRSSKSNTASALVTHSLPPRTGRRAPPDDNTQTAHHPAGQAL